MHFKTCCVGWAVLVSSALAVDCPKTAAAWSQWRQKLVSNLSQPSDLVDGRAAALKECRGLPDQQLFFQDPDFMACMRPLEQALLAIDADKKNSITSGNTSIDLFQLPAPVLAGPDDNPEVQEVPSFFAGKDFLENTRVKGGLTDDAVRALFQRAAAEHPGLETVQFNSRFGLGDQSVITRVPGDRVERWLHMVRDDQGMGLVTILLSVETKDLQGKTLSPPREFFTFYFNHPVVNDPETPPPGGVHGPMMEKMMHSLTDIGPDSHFPVRVGSPQISCVVCHRTGGVLPIPDDKNPKLVSLLPGKPAKQVLADFISRISDHATAALPKGSIPSLGPLIGAYDPESRTDAFVKECASPDSLSSRSIQKIKKAMNCASCHNRDNLVAGPLTYPLGAEGFKNGDLNFTPASILKQMITTGHMPPHPELSEPERNVLHRCLLREFYGGFKSPELGGNPRLGIYLSSLVARACPETPAAHNQVLHRKAKPSDKTHE